MLPNLFQDLREGWTQCISKGEDWGITLRLILVVLVIGADRLMFSDIAMPLAVPEQESDRLVERVDVLKGTDRICAGFVL